MRKARSESVSIFGGSSDVTILNRMESCPLPESEALGDKPALSAPGMTQARWSGVKKRQAVRLGIWSASGFQVP
jgi:hypothetical protein